MRAACAAGSRWQRFALSPEDVGKTIAAYEHSATGTNGAVYSSNGSSPFVSVAVGGHLVTVVDLLKTVAEGGGLVAAGVPDGLASRDYSSAWGQTRPFSVQSGLSAAQGWSSGGALGDWMQMDLGSAKNVLGVQLKGRGVDYQYVKTFKVEMNGEYARWSVPQAAGVGEAARQYSSVKGGSAGLKGPYAGTTYRHATSASESGLDARMIRSLSGRVV